MRACGPCRTQSARHRGNGERPGGSRQERLALGKCRGHHPDKRPGRARKRTVSPRSLAAIATDGPAKGLGNSYPTLSGYVTEDQAARGESARLSRNIP